MVRIHFWFLQIYISYELFSEKVLEYDNVFKHIKAAKEDLKRELHLSEEKKKTLDASLNLMGNLLSAESKPNFTEKNKERLRAKIISKETVYAKAWMLSKLAVI